MVKRLKVYYLGTNAIVSSRDVFFHESTCLFSPQFSSAQKEQSQCGHNDVIEYDLNLNQLGSSEEEGSNDGSNGLACMTKSMVDRGSSIATAAETGSQATVRSNVSAKTKCREIQSGSLDSAGS